MTSLDAVIQTSDHQRPDGEDEGPKEEIKLLPATIDGLGKRFHKVWKTNHARRDTQTSE